MNKRTTINIDREIRNSLQKCRQHKRETYDDVLQRFIVRDGKRRKK